MKLIDWLKVTDILGLSVIVWTKEQCDCNEQEPMFMGSSYDIPWWIAEMKIATDFEDDDDKPISYRSSFGPEYKDKKGFVIVVEEDK